MAGRVVTGALLAAALCLPTLVRADDEDAQLKRLVERIARGDEVEAAAASDELIQLVTGPLASAIGTMADRPVAEQVRLRRVMARLTGALRVRVFQIDLAQEDRKLFDAFAADYPELVARLFDGDWRVRKAAVHQIPLEPNTGAGLLVAAKVDDEDDDVAAAALEMAAELHDDVVIRRLTGYIRDATDTVRSGFYGPRDQDLAFTVALIVFRATTIVAKAQSPESAPVLIDAVRFFSRSRYWGHHQRSEALRSLGRLGDVRAVPVLLDFLDDASPLRWQSREDRKRLTETVGDVALLGLLRIYKLNPGDFGLCLLPSEADFAGYPDDQARREGHRAFRIWHQKHAKDAAQPRPPTSKPTSQRE
jgi:hypothetical protein